MGFNTGGAASGAMSGAAAGSTFGPWGTVAGGIGGGLYGGFFGGDDDENPSDAAQQYLSQIPDTIKPYYQDFINQGKRISPQLEQQFGQLMNDPGSIYNKLGAGYTQSPGYQWRLGQGEEGINNAMASRGMSGTPEHGQRAGQLAENMAGEDFDKYIGHLLGLYQGGLTGMSGLQGQGFDASKELATNLANMLQGQAAYSYAGQAGENSANTQRNNNMWSGLGTIASAMATKNGQSSGAWAGGK